MPSIQQQIQHILDEACESGNERGLQLAIYQNGELIVDQYSGYCDKTSTKPVDKNTLFPVFSVTKGVTATLIHILVEKGFINYDAKIADYWPEFGCKGKEQITVRHALNHSAGLPNMPIGVKPIDLCDWNLMCDQLSELTPIWEPGTQDSYHAITYGWLLGETAQRATGCSFEELLEREILHPLNLTDLFVGLPENQQARVATLDQPEVDPAMLTAPEPAPIPAGLCPIHEMMNSWTGRRTCSPGSSGIMNAQSIAKLYASLLPGGVDGIELLTQERLKLATQREKFSNGAFSERGLGYMLGRDEHCALGPHPTTFGHSGYGGSSAFAEPANRLAIGLTKNLFGPNPQHQNIIYEVRKILQ